MGQRKPQPMHRRRSTLRLALGLVAAASLLACAPTRDNHGNIPLEQNAETIAPGEQTREQVRDALGTPSIRATFEQDEIWYYVGKRTETTAFFAPDVLEHRVLEIRFGADGRVSRVRTVDATKAVKPRLVDRETPTEGNELSILEQFVGNIGRFSPRTDQ